MSQVIVEISMSLDGYVAGPDQSLEEPLGRGGESLHDWAFQLDVWQAAHGREGGRRTASSELFEEHLASIGATIMGRNMFGGQPGPWNADEPWQGWWGTEPPYHHPVFVVTHHAREPLELEGTTFHFVTDGIEAALEQARAAAGGKDVVVAGGGSVANQYLAAGLVDHVRIDIAPILLGDGERLFRSVDDLRGLEHVRSVSAPGVTHVIFERA